MENVNLVKATINDSKLIHSMQIRAFSKLLEKYQDYETNPANEKIDRIESILSQDKTDYLLIQFIGVNVGAIRIDMRVDDVYRISPIFILPEYQNQGIAQEVFKIIEDKYKHRQKWILNTINEEPGNCHLYEKVGYLKTGQLDKVKENMHLVYYEKKIN